MRRLRRTFAELTTEQYSKLSELPIGFIRNKIDNRVSESDLAAAIDSSQSGSELLSRLKQTPESDQPFKLSLDSIAKQATIRAEQEAEEKLRAQELARKRNEQELTQQREQRRRLQPDQNLKSRRKLSDILERNNLVANDFKSTISDSNLIEYILRAKTYFVGNFRQFLESNNFSVQLFDAEMSEDDQQRLHDILLPFSHPCLDEVLRSKVQESLTEPKTISELIDNWDQLLGQYSLEQLQSLSVKRINQLILHNSVIQSSETTNIVAELTETGINVDQTRLSELITEFISIDDEEEEDEDDDESEEEKKERKRKTLNLAIKTYFKSQSVPEPFNSNKIWKIPNTNLTMQFLPRSDTRGLFLGKYTSSCQTIGEVGSPCAIYGQSKSNSQFFIIKESDKIRAQAWVWIIPRSDTECKTVFDNFEIQEGWESNLPDSKFMEYMSPVLQYIKSNPINIYKKKYRCTEIQLGYDTDWEPENAPPKYNPTNIADIESEMYTDSKNVTTLIGSPSSSKLEFKWPIEKSAKVFFNTTELNEIKRRTMSSNTITKLLKLYTLKSLIKTDTINLQEIYNEFDSYEHLSSSDIKYLKYEFPNDFAFLISKKSFISPVSRILLDFEAGKDIRLPNTLDNDSLRTIIDSNRVAVFKKLVSSFDNNQFLLSESFRYSCELLRPDILTVVVSKLQPKNLAKYVSNYIYGDEWYDFIFKYFIKHDLINAKTINQILSDSYDSEKQENILNVADLIAMAIDLNPEDTIYELLYIYKNIPTDKIEDFFDPILKANTNLKKLASFIERKIRVEENERNEKLLAIFKSVLQTSPNPDNLLKSSIFSVIYDNRDVPNDKFLELINYFFENSSKSDKFIRECISSAVFLRERCLSNDRFLELINYFFENSSKSRSIAEEIMDSLNDPDYHFDKNIRNKLEDLVRPYM